MLGLQYSPTPAGSYCIVAPFILTMLEHNPVMHIFPVCSTTAVNSYEREVCTRLTSALCSPRRLSIVTAVVHWGFLTKHTSVCRLICAAICARRLPYSTTNTEEVWALQKLDQETCRTAASVTTGFLV